VEKGPDHHEDVWRRCEQKVDHVVVVVKCRFGECREEVLEPKKRLQWWLRTIDRMVGLPSSTSDTVVCDGKHPGLRIEESELNATKL